ncbi:hypothetical protein AVEN_106792-1 [Araneus ventricosus]|uniref:Uncharacterized protein n=1 Tax=Araneus ventricosus TaxID=182803 RepID=A0A4Y2UQ49_ARAVE|nr:hypothetical protein AVEN_7283-1 [Araneus ventricosus]GBO13501.1 hypothetical protein AVEN_245980-1 [Araneus ventricosus]GBO13814.1 hypothetical protein AVEN_48061-1 [Araneus ventricosus]GBO13816.1 hypothetical protein AVEN_106792-1 [Araneus ventricosus]
MTRTTTPAFPFQISALHTGRAFDYCVLFNVQRAPYPAEFWWSLVSRPEPSGPKAVTLPLSYHAPPLAVASFMTSTNDYRQSSASGFFLKSAFFRKNKYVLLTWPIQPD